MPPVEDENKDLEDRGDDLSNLPEGKEVDKDVDPKGAAPEDDKGAEGAAPEEEDDDVKKEPMLPKSRYDSVAARNRELEARIQELENAGKKEEADAKRQEQVDNAEQEIINLDKQIMQALKDGDDDKAAELRSKQRAAEREQMRLEMRENDQKSVSEAQEQVRLDLTLDAIEENYDQLNPDHDDYDKQLVAEIQELRLGFLATKRYTPTQALIKAVKTLVPDPQVKHTAENTNKGEDPEAKKKNLKKKLDAADKQPPDLDGVGDPGNSGGMGDLPDGSKLTEADLDSLPESSLKRLRGDIF